ncbi:MAG: ATP phosphoribosyltransferase regulatory subunit [Pseudomonadota bacterium]
MTNRSFSDKDRWLLPEGIEEVLPQQAAHLERLRRDLLDLFHSWGYELVLPPLIEYLESLLIGTGDDLDVQTFKLIDQLTGRLMGVRADMTPQVARIDAHRLKREAPTRLCYMGTVLRTYPDGFARTRSPLQLGAELYGHAGIESDVEVLHLMVETLAVTGIKQVHIDLGHVGIFRALAHDAGLDDELEMALFDALQRKARAEIEELLDRTVLDEPQRRMLTALVDLNGGEEVLEEASVVFRGAGSRVLAALDNLRKIASEAARRMPSIPLHFDLAELRGYHYQTGVVYAAFVPGHGQEIARGGRYDDIGKVFGRARPATGFSTDLMTLISLSAQTPYQTRAILAPGDDDPALQNKVSELRGRGERVIHALPGAAGDVQEIGCDRMLERRDGQWTVVPL